MKDDLITGSEVLRTDDLERLEMMAVQLDEAKAFTERGTVNPARLAFILLDNAAEVMMRRNIAVLLMYNRTMERCPSVGRKFWRNTQRTPKRVVAVTR